MTKRLSPAEAAADQTAPPMLFDVVVLDLGDEATALASELLAELGAVVIRVEDRAGDSLRTQGEYRHAAFNAGKRSVAIDTSSEAGWAEVDQLLDQADLVIGPIEPSPAAAEFLDRVRARTVEDPGFGFVEVVFRRGRGPEPVTDLTLTAAGGLTWLSGHPDDPPNQPAGDLGWKQTSLAAAMAAMTLITARRRTGRAGHIEVSAQEAVALTTLQTANGNIHHWSGKVPSRHALPAAFTTIEAADGLWTSFTIHPPNWHRFVEWAELELGDTGLTGPEWDDLDYVAANRSKVAGIVRRLGAANSRADLVTKGQDRGLLVLPVNEVADVADDRHLDARRFWVEVDCESGGPDQTTRTKLAGSAFRSDLGRAPRGAAPPLGADNALLEGPRPTRQLALSADHQTGPGQPDHHQPLRGIRVVDFCWAIAGPLTTRLLADLGADVIKIESNNRTDPIRYIGPQPPDREGSVDTNGVFNDCSANKRAVTINVDSEQGRELVRDLIKTADVVTANYTPDRLDRWGFDWESLQALRPGLIAANLAVMGTWGPDAGWRSYGSGLVAMCGLAAHTGFEGRVPECLGTLHTDFTVPYFAAAQVLAALHHRDRTGEGSYLELSQYESAVRLLDVELAEVLNGGTNPGRLANRSPLADPHGVYRSSGDDRWLAVAARNDTERAALAKVIGAPATDQSVARWTRGRSREEAVAALRSAGVPVSAVEDLGDHQADPEMSRFWSTLELQADLTAKVVNQPIIWDGKRLPLRAAPQWFEHTYEVLVDELGIEPEQFSQLLEDGVLA